MERGGRERGAGLRLVDRGRISVAVVGVDGQEGVRSEESDGRIGEVVWEGNRSESLQEMASDLRWRKWEQWLSSKFYRRIVELRLHERDGNLRKGIEVLGLGRNERKVLERQMRRFVLVEGRETCLFYKERDGQLGRCVLESEVKRVLNELHEEHGHFAAGVTKGRAHGRVYWPSRARDIDRWVASCDSCQRVSKIQRIGDIKPIIQFRPMDMVRMDFVGPISPSCQVTGSVYILVVIDYFSRFLFAIGLPKADQRSTMSALLERVIPVVGWPMTVYTDNGPHFTGQLIQRMWEDHGVIHFPAAISHPQSVGLSERYVQMLMGRIRLKCISVGSGDHWGLYIHDAVLDINTRCIRIHGYTPAQILLGFNPVATRKETTGFEDWLRQALAENSSSLQQDLNQRFTSAIHTYLDERQEAANYTLERLARVQDRLVRKQSPGHQKSEVGDLVLIRDMQLAKDHGRKLEPKWSTPRLLERISASGVSGHVRQLYNPPGITKRFHLDDLLLYIPRDKESFPLPHHPSVPVVSYSRTAMGAVDGSFTVNRRAFDFGDITGLYG